MPIISYEIRGRFGNNLFQYYATQVLMKLLNEFDGKYEKYEFKYRNEITSSHPDLDLTPNGYIKIEDDKFLQYYRQLKNKKYPKELRGKNIWMFGFYQFYDFLKDNMDFVQSLFSVDNKDHINDQISMDQFAYQIKVENCPSTNNNNESENVLYLHTRLDDFLQYGHNNNIISFPSYVTLIKDSIIKENPHIDTVIIVVDKIRRDFEAYYLTNFIKEITNIPMKCSYHSGNMWQDFAMLYYAKNLVCSNSTFCWWAGLLGDSFQNWFPDTMKYNENQQFNKLNDKTKVFKVAYWRD